MKKKYTGHIWHLGRFINHLSIYQLRKEVFALRNDRHTEITCLLLINQIH